MQKELTCIICPTGCRITISCQEGAEPKIEGALCPKGKRYAGKEITCPTRLLTTTIEVEGSELPLVSVRTDAELPKDLLMPAMRTLAKLKIPAPVSLGQVLLENILDTGVNIVATRKIDIAAD